MSDAELVQHMLAGDEEAFDEFFGRFFPALYRFALSRLNCDADGTEDVVQSTLCRAIDKLHTFRGEATLLTWLCTLCRHEISDEWRRRHSRRSTWVAEGSPETPSPLDTLASADTDRPDVALDRDELSRLVHVTLDTLPARYGDALEWKYIQGLSVNEIAGRLALGPKAAESLLTRARQAFRSGFRQVSRGGPRDGLPQ